MKLNVDIDDRPLGQAIVYRPRGLSSAVAIVSRTCAEVGSLHRRPATLMPRRRIATDEWDGHVPCQHRSVPTL